jgi:hypothetical protein
MTASGGAGNQELRQLLQRALILRVGVALILHLLSTDALFAPDQDTYHYFGAWLAKYWAGDLLVYPWKLLESGPAAYYYIVAALYYVFGESPLVPKLVNAVVGTITVRLVYDVASMLSDRPSVALRAATYAAYFPSLVLWSVLNIRDCWVVLLIALICREAMILQEGFRVSALLVLVSAIFAIIQFRDYILFAVTAPAAVSFLVRNRKHVLRNTFLGMLVVVAIIYADRSAGADRSKRSIDLETLQEIRQGTAVGDSRFAPTADISTPEKALTFLPIGLAFFLLAPFPWTISNLRQAITLPEMLFFYSLIPAMVRGVLHLVRHRLRNSLMVLLITAGLTVGYALGEANAGTAYRHRAQILAFYLIFAAVGVEARQARREGAGALGVAAPAM